MEIQVQKAFDPIYIKKKDGKKMLRKRSKKFHKQRKTKLVRLSEKWHQQLKMMNLSNCNTISKRADRMCELFFRQNPELRVPTSKQTYTKDLLS